MLQMITRNSYKKKTFFEKKSIYIPTLCFVFFMLVFNSLTCNSQQIERKIIIDKGICYYTTIDPEFQIATLYACSFNEPLKNAKKLVLPAGRNFNLPVIPFCWDIAGADVLAINFINNAGSNRKQAIKRIPIRSLNEWDEKTSISDVVMESATYPPYTSFEPYKYIIEKSNVLDHFFFDGIALSDSSFCFAIANNSELSLWQYSNNEWTRGAVVAMETNDFFSLFTYRALPYMIMSDGRIYGLKSNKIINQPEKKINEKLNNIVLIINKMNNTVSFMNAAAFDDKKSITELLVNATAIF
jgi:hypothetical protein